MKSLTYALSTIASLDDPQYHQVRRILFRNVAATIAKLESCCQERRENDIDGKPVFPASNIIRGIQIDHRRPSTSIRQHPPPNTVRTVDLGLRFIEQIEWTLIEGEIGTNLIIKKDLCKGEEEKGNEKLRAEIEREEGWGFKMQQNLSKQIEMDRYKLTMGVKV